MNTKRIVLDAHQHFGPWPFPGHWGGIDVNLDLMARRGIDIAIISSTRAIVENMERGNAELIEAVTAHNSLYGYITLNPTKIEASRRELLRYKNMARMVGVKIHTHYSGCAMGDPRTARAIEMAAEASLPVLIHTWGVAAVAALECIAARLPDARILMAHAGGDAWREGIAAAEQQSNLYLDFTCSTPYAGAIERAIAILGAERVLFGTDATLFDPAYMRARFDAISMTTAQRNMIMGANALSIFGISVPPEADD